MAVRETIDRFLLELRAALEGVDDSEFEAMLEAIQGSLRFFVFGMGRTGQVLGGFVAQLSRVDRAAHIVLQAGCPALGTGDFLLLASASGAARTLTVVAEEAVQRGAKVGLITANALSPLAVTVDQRLILPPVLTATSGEDSPLLSLQIRFEQALTLVLDALAEALS